MCTSIAYHGNDFCFGRNMDIEYSFGERLIVCGRRFPFNFRCANTLSEHNAIIGVGTVIDGYPLYADAMNEHGLCIAGLNFPKYAHFPKTAEGNALKLAPFEIIPYLLGRCATVSEVKDLLSSARIVDIPFSSTVPNATLHWHIADRASSITVESTREGLRVYDNGVNVLANSPSFDFMLEHLGAFSNLNCGIDGERTSLGYGAVGLPGDLSSASRFVRAAFLLGCSPRELSCETACDHLLSLLAAVAMTDGAVTDGEGKTHKTVYASCMYPDEGKYIIKQNGYLTPSSFSLSDFELSCDRTFCLDVF